MRDYVLGQLESIKRLSEETMLQTVEQWQPVLDHDVFGGEVLVYSKVDTYACGLKIILVSERHNFTGTDETVDAILRIPYDKISAVTPKTRFKVIDDEAAYSYECVGPVRPGLGCGVVEVTKVQF